MSELVKKPEFWVSVTALVVSGGSTLYLMKEIGQLTKRVNVMDQALGTLMTKLGGKNDFPKLDEMIIKLTQVDKVAELEADVAKMKTASAKAARESKAREAKLLEEASRASAQAFEGLNLLLKFLEKDGKDVKKLSKKIAELQRQPPPGVPVAAAPPAREESDESEEEEDPMKSKKGKQRR